MIFDFIQNPILILLVVPTILVSLTVHEVAHGYVAYKCGDRTAKDMGRLTLNPLYHLDPIGALMMLFIGFGWAKPVPVTMRNLRKPRRDIALVSLAGPVSNLLLALLGALGYVACNKAFIGNPDSNVIATLGMFFFYFVILNIGLAVFNLIPVPPLDGSKIVSSLLPPLAAAKYLRIELYTRYIFLALILLSWLPAPLDVINDVLWFPIQWLRDVIFDGFTGLWAALLGLF